MGDKLRHILIIDDDEINNLLCRKVLEIADVADRVSFSTNVQGGLCYFGNYQNGLPVPELVLLDINMPVEDGFDFLDQYNALGIDQHPCPTKIIMLTTSVYEKDREKALSYPCVVDYLVKPLTKELIQNRVKTHFFVRRRK